MGQIFVRGHRRGKSLVRSFIRAGKTKQKAYSRMWTTKSPSKKQRFGAVFDSASKRMEKLDAAIRQKITRRSNTSSIRRRHGIYL